MRVMGTSLEVRDVWDVPRVETPEQEELRRGERRGEGRVRNGDMFFL